MTKKEILIIADYSEESRLSLEEICEICELPTDTVQEFVHYEILSPTGELPDEWVFDLIQLQRLQTALRLKRDLEVNIAGIALVLDLLDELEEHRAKVEILEKHLLR